MSTYSEIVDRAAFDAAMRLARGTYQANILRGAEAMSGATLKGRAKRYGARYAESRNNLIARCQAAGLPVREERRAHGKRVLVIGVSS